MAVQQCEELVVALSPYDVDLLAMMLSEDCTWTFATMPLVPTFHVCDSFQSLYNVHGHTANVSRHNLVIERVRSAVKNYDAIGNISQSRI